MANTNGYRFIRGANNDNTLQQLTMDTITQTLLPYATTYALLPDACQNYYDFAQLTGNATITADTTQPLWGDTMILQFAADSSNRTVTFSTGFAVSASTLVVVASKFGNITFMFTANGWIETARTLTA